MNAKTALLLWIASLVQIAVCATNESPTSPAGLREEGAFGFPQKQATVFCDSSELRFSVWNNQEYLFAQAVLWKDNDSSLGRTDGDRKIGDWSELLLDVDADGQRSPEVDRVYLLNPWPSLSGLHYQVFMGHDAWSTIKSDSKGRGAIRYLDLADGNRVRIDTYLIPLSEISRKVGDKIRVCFWGSSPKPLFTIDSAGYQGGAHYYAYNIPVSTYHDYVLTNGSDIAVGGVPDGQNDGANDGVSENPQKDMPMVGQTPPEIPAITGAHAAMVYVTTNGSGHPPYDSWTNAAPSIQVAIDSARNGDKVVVGPGTYRGKGNRDLDFRGKAITVRGDQGAASTRLEVGGSYEEPHRAFRFSHGESHSSVIDGFTVTGGYGPKDVLSTDGKRRWNVGGAIYCIASSPVILNCEFRNNYADYGSAIQLWNQSHAEIANCQFIENHRDEVGGCVVYAYNKCHASVSNCTFARNEGCALKVDMFSEVTAFGCLAYANSRADAAVYVGNSSLSLINCTIADNQCSRSALSTWFSRAAIVRNCILWNVDANGSEIGGSNTVTVINSCVRGGHAGVSVITNNPLFVAQGRDYRLIPASPCINAGTNQPWMAGAKDLDGRPRIIDGNVDAGAYEYGAVGMSPGIFTKVLIGISLSALALWILYKQLQKRKVQSAASV
jgi:hypothetical protein